MPKGKYENLKYDVLECAKWLSENGFFGGKLGSGGNVSAFVRRDNRMVITPSGQPYGTLGMEDMCVVDTELNRNEGALAPSIEAGMHVGIYRQRPDVSAIVHTHQVYASVFALINRSIPALFDEIVYEIGPTIEIIPYAVSGSRKLVDHVVTKLDNGCYCYIIQNHGALSFGADLPQATRNAELLEKVAQVYFYALSTGEKISQLPVKAVRQVLEMREK